MEPAVTRTVQALARSNDIVLFMATGLDVVCRLLRVEGRVQGVGYREACVQQAQLLGLVGWVRNRRDGAVEVMLQGPADSVARMQVWLHDGPPQAQVDRVTVSEHQPLDMPPMRHFERRPTQ